MDKINLATDVMGLRNDLIDLPEFKNTACKKSFEGFLEKIEQINKLYEVEKYRVVFIGEPGKGKTTAICNWLDLLKKDKCKEKRIDAVSLLATASGRTTVAEVHIKQITGLSHINIEYMSKERQIEYIRDFCNYYYSMCFGNDSAYEKTVEENDNEAVSVHLEIDRVVRNMAGIESYSENNPEKQNRIMKFMNSFKDEEEFYNYVLEKIDIDNRQCSEIIYDDNSNETFENWLSKTFKEINDGKRRDCSIASKVFININRDDLDMKFIDCVDEVIDTVGLDSTVRTDLQELLLSENTICFIMDDLKNVPSRNVSSLIKGTFLSNWDKYYSVKTSIFVKSPLSELIAVNEADGDPDLGIEIKNNELKRRVDSDGIPYLTENTLFQDSCEAYNIKIERIQEIDENGHAIINPNTGRPKVKTVTSIEDYKHEIADSYRCAVNYKITGIIERLKANLQKDADNIRTEVLRLLDSEQKFKNEVAEEELSDVRARIEEKSGSMVPRFRAGDVKNIIISKAITDIHWRTIKKMNSLYGGYQLWHTDIYTQIMQAGKEYFAENVKAVYTELKEILIDVRNEDARCITAGYLNMLDSLIKESTEKMGEFFLKWALNDGFAPRSDENPFWNEVNDISGKGYKKRVTSCYEDHIYDGTVMLARKIATEIEHVINNLVQMFPGE